MLFCSLYRRLVVINTVVISKCLDQYILFLYTKFDIYLAVSNQTYVMLFIRSIDVQYYRRKQYYGKSYSITDIAEQYRRRKKSNNRVILCNLHGLYVKHKILQMIFTLWLTIELGREFTVHLFLL